ncbi:hypothetical protein ACOMHN_031156 [Nucella lapillus]
MPPRLVQYGPCALIFLALLAVSSLLPWLVSLVTPSQVLLDLRGLEIPAVYRQAVRRADGSIDLTINIPASLHVHAALLDRQEQIR